MGSVERHNYDDPSCLWKDGNSDYEKDCTFETGQEKKKNVVPILEPKNESDGPILYTRSYTKTNLSDSPMLWLSRVADNMDAKFTRLSKIQRPGYMQKFWQRLYLDVGIRKANDKNAKKKALEDAIARAIEAIPELDAKLKEDVKGKLKKEQDDLRDLKKIIYKSDENSW